MLWFYIWLTLFSFWKDFYLVGLDKSFLIQHCKSKSSYTDLEFFMQLKIVGEVKSETGEKTECFGTPTYIVSFNVCLFSERAVNIEGGID